MRNTLKAPSQEQIDCQHPKPILLDTGEMKVPYAWAVRRLFPCNKREIFRERERGFY